MRGLGRDLPPQEARLVLRRRPLFKFWDKFVGACRRVGVVVGLAEMSAPQAVSPAGQLPSASVPVPNVDGQGRRSPLYGEANIAGGVDRLKL